LRQVQRGGGPAAQVTEVPVVAEKTEMELAIERMEEVETRVEAAAEVVAPPPLPSSQIRRKLVDFGDETVPVPVSGPRVEPEEVAEPKEPFSLERFMGVKLFAWLGGVAMFFGVILFVKYAFENNLIPPAVRIALGFVTGTGLLIGGLATHRLPKYRVLAGVLRDRRADPLRGEFRGACGLSFRGVRAGIDFRADGADHAGRVFDRGAA
jgi:uncharacterized membrane protein